MSFGGSAFSNLTFGGHGIIVYELGATAITTAAPTIPAVDLARTILTSSEEIATGSPTNGSPTIVQDEKLTAPELATPAPIIDAANGGENERFFAGELSTTPVLGTSPIVQQQVIAIGNLDSAAVSVPAISMQELEQFAGASITTAAPTVATTVLVHNIVLASANIDTAASVIASTSIEQVEVLNAADITTGGIDFGVIPLVQEHAIQGQTFDTLRPTFSDPTFEQDEKLEAVAIATGAFDHPSSVSMFEEETLSTANILFGSTFCDSAPMLQDHIVEQEEFVFATPILDEPLFLANNVLATPDLDYSIIIDTAPFVENNVLSVVPITTGQPLIPANTMFEAETFIAANLITGVPTNSVSPINQTHIIPNQDDLNTGSSSTGTAGFNQGQTLDGQDLDSQSHVLGQPLFAYNYVLDAANINSSPVSVPSVTMQENETFTASSISTGQPVVDDTSSVINYNFSSPNILTGNPSVPATVMVRNIVIVGQSILTGNPDIPILIYNAALGRIADFESNALGLAVLTIQTPNEVVLVDNNTKADDVKNDPNDAVLLVDGENRAVLAA